MLSENERGAVFSNCKTSPTVDDRYSSWSHLPIFCLRRRISFSLHGMVCRTTCDRQAPAESIVAKKGGRSTVVIG
jgi:hypothetical protein